MGRGKWVGPGYTVLHRGKGKQIGGRGNKTDRQLAVLTVFTGLLTRVIVHRRFISEGIFE